jgi:hypothetical protein
VVSGEPIVVMCVVGEDTRDFFVDGIQVAWLFSIGTLLDEFPMFHKPS